MPRRRALTEAQMKTLLALPSDEACLIRHWTLDGADRATVERRRGGHNQLGYALQLCTFRYPGRLLRPGEAIADTALRFVADQLHVVIRICVLGFRCVCPFVRFTPPGRLLIECSPQLS